ncbi:MAG: hypothetical protein IT454_04730 [Planctomycetes bacterium]|nr:hypothetical protein [Planctomycetota bacterium]
MKIAGIVLALLLMIGSLAGVVWFKSPKPSKRAHATEPVRAAAAEPARKSPERPKVRVKLPASSEPTTALQKAAHTSEELPEAPSERSAAVEPVVHGARGEPELERPTSHRADAGERGAGLQEQHSNLKLLVRDARGAALEGAEVLAKIRGPRGTVEVACATRSDGALDVPTHTGDIVSLEVRAPGHATAFAGPLALATADERAFAVTLEHGARLAGTVLLDGEPAEEFELSFWPARNEGLRSTREMRGARGAFAIDEARDTLLGVAVVAPNGASAVLDAASGDELELELHAPVLVRGELAANARRATVQAWVASRGIAVLAAGEPHAVDEAGAFELSVPRDGVLSIQAEGCAPRWVQVGSGGELGTLELDQRRALEVRLELPESRDPAHVELSAWGIEELPITRFDEHGSVRFDDVAPGFYCFALRGDDGWERCIEHQLAPGADWTLVLRER